IEALDGDGFAIAQPNDEKRPASLERRNIAGMQAQLDGARTVQRHHITRDGPRSSVLKVHYNGIHSQFPLGLETNQFICPPDMPCAGYGGSPKDRRTGTSAFSLRSGPVRTAIGRCTVPRIRTTPAWQVEIPARV